MPEGRKLEVSRLGCESQKGTLAEMRVALDLTEMGWEVFHVENRSVDMIIRSPLDNHMLSVEVKTAKNDNLNKYTPWFRDRERPGRQWDILAVVKKDHSVYYFNSQFERLNVGKAAFKSL